MKTEDVKKYITEDGKEFFDEDKAKYHESMIRSASTISEIEKFICTATTGRDIQLDKMGNIDDGQLSDFYDVIDTQIKPFDDVDTPHDLAVIAVNMVLAMDGLMLKAIYLAEKLLYEK